MNLITLNVQEAYSFYTQISIYLSFLNKNASGKTGVLIIVKLWIKLS